MRCTLRNINIKHTKIFSRLPFSVHLKENVFEIYLVYFFTQTKGRNFYEFLSNAHSQDSSPKLDVVVVKAKGSPS